MTPVLERLAELLRAQGGLMAGLVDEAPGVVAERSHPAALVAAGPRAAAAAAEYELLVEMIFEGYLLHYASPRVVRCEDQDLGLLAGDQLYAAGLARLVALGDLAAVSELADVISLCALAQAAAEQELADAIWAAGARAVGWGPGSAHERAKELTRLGSREALAAMRAVGAP